jgi:hypothetical protein
MKNKYIYIIVIVLIFVFSLIFIFFTNCSYRESYDLNIELVNNDRVFYPKLFTDKNEIYYLSDLGIIWYKYNLNTNEKTIIFDDEVLGIEQVLYAPNSNNAVVYSNYPEYNIRHYDFEKNVNYKLNNDIGNISWQGNNLLYVFNKFDESAREKYLFEITQSFPDGSNWKPVRQIKSEQNIGITIYSIKEGEYYYTIIPSNEYSGSTLYKGYNSNAERVDRISKDQQVFSELYFSKDFSKVFYIGSDQDLLLQDLNKIEKIDNFGLKIENTHGLSWSNDGKYIYYLESLDKLTRIEIANKKTTTYNLDNSQIVYINMLDQQVKNLGLSSDDQILYFTYNNYIYSVNLK